MNVYHMNAAILACALQLLKAWVKIMKLPIPIMQVDVFVCVITLNINGIVDFKD